MNNFLSIIIRPGGWAAFVISMLAAVLGFYLHYSGSLEQVILFLDDDMLSINIGNEKYSVYKVLKMTATLMILLWFAGFISDFGTNRIKQVIYIRSSNRNLIRYRFWYAENCC